MPGTEELHQYAPARRLRSENIPNLDFAPFFRENPDARTELIAKVRKACLESGFFYIHNSGVADGTIVAALDAIKQFFNCPDDGPVKQKVNNLNTRGKRGWGPMFSEPAYQENTVACLESFDLGQQLSDEEYAALDIQPNIWPDQRGFRQTVTNYYDEITALGRALAAVLSEILGEDRDFINRHSGATAPRTMRLLHYPANKQQLDERKVGIAAHTDFECFTIMNQTAAGLEVTNVEGDWCQAPADIGTFTVILGDMLERFSNGYLKATGHRVVNTPWTRYSMVLFFAVDGDYQVQPLPRFISQDRPCRYQAISQDDHIERELERVAAFSTQGFPN